MNNFFAHLAATAWTLVPVVLLFFMISGIIFVNQYKMNEEKRLTLLKSIAESLEVIANSNNYRKY